MAQIEKRPLERYRSKVPVPYDRALCRAERTAFSITSMDLCIVTLPVLGATWLSDFWTVIFRGGNTRKHEKNDEKNIYLMQNQFLCPRKLLGILDTMPEMWYT
jgi:hypothetical protein